MNKRLSALEERQSSLEAELRDIRRYIEYTNQRIDRRDNGKVVEVEEGRYGMLMMVLCDRWGRVYDVWISVGSMHEVRAFRERKKRSVWFRELVENCVAYGDRASCL